MNREVLQIGMVAGNGTLPLKVLEYCKDNNITVFCVLLKNFADRSNYLDKENVVEFPLGHVGKVLRFFKSKGIREIIFCGGLKKPSFSSIRCDFSGFLLLKQILKNRMLGDNTVLETVIKFLEKRGFTVGNINHYTKNDKFIEGFNGKITPKDKEFLDNINLGKEVITRLSELDIGQSVVVQQKNVLAIECFEGTQRLIERSKGLIYENGTGAFLLKMKKIGQTDKIDLPTVGVDTILQLRENNFVGLVVDCENCIVLDKDRMIELADEGGLFIYGI